MTMKSSSYTSSSCCPFSSSYSLSRKPYLDPALPPRPGSLDAPSFLSIGSVIYSVGGFDRPIHKPLINDFAFSRTPLTPSNKVFCIDTLHPDQGWKEAPPMNAERRHPYLVSTDDGKIYAFGGLNMRLPLDPDGKCVFVEVCDPNPNAWFELARLGDVEIKSLRTSVNGHAVVDHGNSDRKILFHSYFCEDLFYLHTTLHNDVGVYDDKFGEHPPASDFLDGILHLMSRQRLHAYVVSSGRKMPVDLRDARPASISLTISG